MGAMTPLMLPVFLLLAISTFTPPRLVSSFSATPPSPPPPADANTNTWRSGIRNPASGQTNAIDATRALCRATPCRPPDTDRGESGLAFLFVSQKWADSFADIVQTAHATLGGDAVTLISVVGGGVVGGGVESDDPTLPAVSLLCGILPPTAGVETFAFGPNEAPPSPASSGAWKAIGRDQDVPSYVIFADPWSPLQRIMDGLDSSGIGGSAVVAGGLSCPTFGEEGPTVGVNGKAYPRGTAVGVGLSGSVGLQAVVAQGCRPVGPAYDVTEVDGNMIVELDHKPAAEILSTIMESDYLTEEDKALVESGGLLCGLAAPSSSDVLKGDYLIRQIMGFRHPAIMIGAEAKKGDTFRFHVRDSKAARDDLENMIGRAKTERMFAGSEKSGVPLAALQISCVARGRPLFGGANVDLENVRKLLGSRGDDAAVAGFYANGEIGPVGISGVGLTAKQTHMHGFTTVAATICDFGTVDPTSASMPPSNDESTEEVSDFSAWE